jgi:hypothetical protein
MSLGGLVGIGSLYTSTEDLEGRIKKTAVNSTLSGNNFGGATDAIVCLDVNACCIDVVVGIKSDVVATEC